MERIDQVMAQMVYESLWKGLEKECRIVWVEDATAPGSYCMQEYGKMRDAYDRLLERLGEKDEDRDVEDILNALGAIQDYLAMKMFEYGTRYGKNCID